MTFLCIQSINIYKFLFLDLWLIYNFPVHPWQLNSQFQSLKLGNKDLITQDQTKVCSLSKFCILSRASCYCCLSYMKHSKSCRRERVKAPLEVAIFSKQWLQYMKMKDFSWMGTIVCICIGWGCEILLFMGIILCIFALLVLMKPCSLICEIIGC